MGTRSMIGMVMDDGKIKGIYCHWDGYEDHNGKILVKHYTTEEKVESLLNLGDISSLSESIECPEGHSYKNSIKGYTVAYMRDRGEEDCEARIEDTVEFLQQMSFGYLFENGKWFTVKHGDEDPAKRLTRITNEIEPELPTENEIKEAVTQALDNVLQKFNIPKIDVTEKIPELFAHIKTHCENR